MSKESSYIGQGILLALLVLVGMGVIYWIGTARPTESVQAMGKVAVDREVSVSFGKRVNGRGEKLFRENCSSCHMDGRASDIDGPTLKGIDEKIKDRALLYGWIRNSDSVLKSGNAYFNALYEKWNKTGMSPSPHLTDEDIDNILDYINDIYR